MQGCLIDFGGGGDGFGEFFDPIAMSTMLAKSFSVFLVTVIRTYLASTSFRLYDSRLLVFPLLFNFATSVNFLLSFETDTVKL